MKQQSRMIKNTIDSVTLGAIGVAALELHFVPSLFLMYEPHMHAGVLGVPGSVG
jgi:hypothetical protein